MAQPGRKNSISATDAKLSPLYASKKKQMRLLVNLIIVAFISSCGNPSEKYMEYKPLSEFDNDTSLIKTGDHVKLLAFSGGKQDDSKNMYYQQILVVNKSDGDTISIICTSLRIPSDQSSGKFIFISPFEFNPDRNIQEAVYERQSDSLTRLFRTMSAAMDLANESNESGTIEFDKLNRNKNELVTVNKRLPDFSKKYKTVIGILKFVSDPR